MSLYPPESRSDWRPPKMVDPRPIVIGPMHTTPAPYPCFSNRFFDCGVRKECTACSWAYIPMERY